MRANLAVVLAALASCSASDDLHGPSISAVTPSHAPPGNTVLITGSYFCHQPPNDDPLACENVGTVSFGASVVGASLYTDTSIMVEVPNGRGVVSLTVTVVGRVSNTVSFTIE